MSVVFRWLPNSWFQIEASVGVVHIDPATSPSAPMPVPNDMKRADLVLVTHHHRDHCDPGVIDTIAGPDTPVYATRMCAEEVEGRPMTVVSPGDEFDSAGMHVRVVDAYNTPEGSSTQKAHHKGECVGYVITVDGLTVYHAGDTDLIPEMSQLGEVDVALLPVGGTFTMDAEEAARAALEIDAGVCVPMHNRGTDPQPFQKALSGSGVTVVILRPGGELEIDTDDF